MRIRRLLSILVATSALGVFAGTATPQKASGSGMLAHMVYFDLKDPSGPSRANLVAACRKYLKDHPGIVFFAAGTVAEEFNRDVNVRDFHVSLHIVFKSKADHDRYQTAPAHQQFIKENSSGWARVRVFDSYVD